MFSKLVSKLLPHNKLNSSVFIFYFHGHYEDTGNGLYVSWCRGMVSDSKRHGSDFDFRSSKLIIYIMLLVAKQSFTEFAHSTHNVSKITLYMGSKVF